VYGWLYFAYGDACLVLQRSARSENAVCHASCSVCVTSMNQLLMSLCPSLVYLMCCARGVIIIIIIIIINSIRTQRSVNVASEVSCPLTPDPCHLYVQ